MTEPSVMVCRSADGDHTEIRVSLTTYAVTRIDDLILDQARARADLLDRSTQETKRVLVHEIDRWLREYADHHAITLPSDRRVSEAYARGRADERAGWRPIA